ncbi:prepilin-type N-terminal cleavage/methylation domain-containing protein [Elusimicrobium posterum]|uniref:type IV pilin protein n=1 Tax=Elusimicrobium posterum TaxID=3116653 RepID=UPI003C7588FD
MTKGFTLIELLVVVLIIGILAAIALPQYTKAVERSRSVEAVSILKALGEAGERYYLQTGTVSHDPDDFDIEIAGLNKVINASENQLGRKGNFIYFLRNSDNTIEARRMDGDLTALYSIRYVYSISRVGGTSIYCMDNADNAVSGKNCKAAIFSGSAEPCSNFRKYATGTCYAL